MGRWLLRMSLWARNPPSKKRVQFVLGIIVVALLIAGMERMGWWPDWATAQRMRR